MEFTTEDVRAFIINQRTELVNHCRFLQSRYGWTGSEQDAAVDWARRYATDYRDIGSRLLSLLWTHPRRCELFSAGMAEIARHKYFRSELLGYDLGLKVAGEEWLLAHFPTWVATV